MQIYPAPTKLLAISHTCPGEYNALLLMAVADATPVRTMLQISAWTLRRLPMLQILPKTYGRCLAAASTGSFGEQQWHH